VPADPETQIANAFANVKASLEAVGGTTGDIGKMTVFLADRNMRDLVNKPWLAMFPNEHDRPVRHTIGGPLGGNFIIQIEFVAVVENNAPGEQAMSTIRILYRDYDRAPYLFTLQATAKRYGLDLVLEKAELGGRFPEFLLEGSTDFLAENYWQLQALRAKGQPLVSLATAVSTLNEKLFVHPSVRAVGDLRGKKLAIRGIGPSQTHPQPMAQGSRA